MKQIYIYSLIVWGLFVLLASINGLIRDNYYEKYVGELYAHQISTVLLVLILLGVMYVFFNKFGAVYRKRDLWIIGGAWVLMTVIFEFVFGHYVIGHSWSVLFEDYNLFKGRLWSLVLIFIFLGPRLVARD